MRTMIAAVLLAGLVAGCQPAAEADISAGAVEAAAETPTADASTTYADPALRVSFDHAAGYTTGPCDAETPNCVGVFAAGGEEPLIRVETYAADLATVAREQAGFEPDAEGVLMTTYGRFEPQPVADFSGEGWQGQRATVTCGIEDAETGFHAAGGECIWAVVSDGARSVMVTSDGLQPGAEAAELALSTLRLTPTAG